MELLGRELGTHWADFGNLEPNPNRKARRSRYDTAIPMQDRWLFPGNKRGKPMTTRQLSRLFHEAADAAGIKKAVTLPPLAQQTERLRRQHDIAVPRFREGRLLRPLDCSTRMIFCALSICLTFSLTTSLARMTQSSQPHGPQTVG